MVLHKKMVWYEQKGEAFSVCSLWFTCGVGEGVGPEGEGLGVICRNVCVWVCHEARNLATNSE